MEPITYSLRAGTDGQRDFSSELSAFTDEFLVAATRLLSDIPAEYRHWIAAGAREPLRSDGEYLFDILSLGILDRVYRGRARVTSPVVCQLLARLYEGRLRYRRIKPAIDTVRGIFATVFLAHERNETPHMNTTDIHDLQRLIGWLAATGEYREEVKRFRLFRDWLADIPVHRREDLLASVQQLVCWFEVGAAETFGCYTSHVPRFLQRDHVNHRWREDVIFCGRKEVEYHLGMLSIEIMNRAFADAFRATSRKAVLLPACMRRHRDHSCRARTISLNMVCAECDDGCAVSRYTRLGREHDFDVHIIPHSSDFTAWLKTWAVDRNIGVVGVACLLNLITGGLELKSLNIPAQCVPLEYCGCASHWHETGITTALAEDALFRVLGISTSFRT